MSINYPTSLDSFPNPSSTDKVNNATTNLKHSVQHGNVNDAVEALEAKVGVDGSAVTTSHDYKLSEVTGSDKAVGKTATQTLSNKTLTSPTIGGTTTDTATTTKTGTFDATGATVSVKDVNFSIKDDSDPTKIAQFQASSITTGTTRTKTLQDNNGTLYETGGTDVAIADGGTGASTATEGFDNLAPTTTKGDLIVRDTNDNIRLAVGSNNQILVADSSVAGGVKWASSASIGAGKIDINSTEVIISGSTAETTLFSATVSGGVLSTNNGLRGKVVFSDFDFVSGDSMTLRLKYGGSTLITQVVTFNQTDGDWEGEWDFTMVADGATNAQKLRSVLMIFNPVDDGDNDFQENNGSAGVQMDKIIATKYGTGAVDSTANQTLAVTAQFSASVSNGLTAEYWIVEAIR